MSQQLGETREPMCAGAMKYVSDFVSNMSHEKEPYWVCYCARPNYLVPNQIKQTVRAYGKKPPACIGILTWYVDPIKGIFEFLPELSAPWDMPQNPDTISEKSEDRFERVMQRGQELEILTT